MNVVLFPRDETRVQILGLLNVDPVSDIHIQTERFIVFKHTYEGHDFYTSSFGDTETEAQFVDKLQELCRQQDPWIPIVCAGMPTVERMRQQIQRRIHHGTANTIVRKLGIELDDTVVEAMNEILLNSVTLRTNLPPVFMASLVHFIRQHAGQVQDDDFLRVQDATLFEGAGGNKREVKRVKIEKTWEQILHETPDPVATPSDPVCCVCFEFRASICFVDCSHQACCDKCAREILTRDDTKKECPVCREPISTKIIRPIPTANTN